MTKSSIAARALPVLIVAVVLGASLATRPVSLNALNVALCGYGYGYGYGQKPAVDGVSPTIGPTTGGTSVSLTGCGFTGATAVKFGTTNAITFTVNSDTSISATSPAHAAGTVDVSVTTPAGTSPSQSGDQFTYSNTCTSVSLTASPPSPQSSGTQVTLTAVGTCPSASPKYEFWARWAGSSTWVLLQGYSTSNTYLWNSTGALAGTENFGVWVKDASSSAQYDALASIPYTVTGGPACSAVSVSPSPASVNEGAGTHVTLTASSTCPHASPKYEFWAKWQGTSTWQLLQGYSLSNTYDWNSTGALPGVETFGVWVKDAQSSNQYDAVNNTTVTVARATCSAVTIVPVPNTVVHGQGTHVTITAAATGCTNSTGQQYEFWMRPALSKVWLKVQSYSATATYDWNSTGATAQQINFGVWAKDKNSSNTVDVFQSTTVTVT